MSAWQSVLDAGPASLDQAMAAICGSMALALAWWLLAALGLSLLAALGSGTSAAGRALARGARLLAPRILRNAVAALLGVAIVATPACANARSVQPGSGQAPAVIAAAPREAAETLSPAWVPARPAAGPTGAAVPNAGATKTQTAGPSPDPDLRPGWLPTRPAGTRPTAPASAGATPPAPVPTGRRSEVDRDEELVVRRGDTLWSLAERHLGPGATAGEIALAWPQWFAANRHVIGSDPDVLQPGQRLRPPEPGGRHRAVDVSPNHTTKAESRTGGAR